MHKKLKLLSICLSVALVAGFLIYALAGALTFPDNLILLEDQRADFGKLYSMDIAPADRTGALSNGAILDNRLNLQAGKYEGTVKMFGMLDFKTVQVDVIKNKKLVPCGNSIGVKLFTDGLLVVGITDFEDETGKTVSPAKKSGVKVGDLIKEVNGVPVKNVAQFTEIVENAGSKDIFMKLLRDGQDISCGMQAVKTKPDGTYKLGMWVRDSTAGIGTLTFYDPEDKVFGALGHGISDVDTGELMPAAEGSILGANIISVKKGEKGVPGELQGVFLGSNTTIGSLKSNTKYGIYGEVLSDKDILGEALPIALKEDVKEGPAYILSNVEGQKVQKFDVEIQKVMEQNERSTKGMIVKITDPSLLDKTGGIVQGMSGSPILQDGKLIGAVTHVFVNDPERGYGIFIETMLKNAYQP